MNRRSLIPFLLLAAACGPRSPEPPVASAPPATTMAPAPSPMGPSLEAEVVMLDPAAPSITLREGDVPATRSPRAKDLKMGDRTIRVEPAAAASLSALKPGVRVRVTCSASPAVVVDPSPAMGAASPAAGAAASPRMGMASPGPMGGGLLAQCDSIVALAPLETTPAP
jgi:hypothetical protein